MCNPLISLVYQKYDYDGGVVNLT